LKWNQGDYIQKSPGLLGLINFTLPEYNRAEKEFLKILDYRLYVLSETFESYENELKELIKIQREKNQE
jgi:hypothetical protein